MIIGVILAIYLPYISTDDYFRVHYALWWWEHPGFTSSYVWLPGHHYIYGIVIGLTKDTFLAPRLTSLAFFIGTALVALTIPNLKYLEKLVAVIWILFTPLLFVLASIPLSEPGMIFFLLSGISLLLNFRENKNPLTLLFSAICFMGAAMFRYEAWLSLILFYIYGRGITANHISKITQKLILMMPFFFPFVWIIFCFASQGKFMAFLFATTEDHYGQGSFIKSILSPTGITILLELILILAAIVYQVRKKGLQFFKDDLFLSFLVVTSIPTVIYSLAGALPSQYTERIFASILIIGSVFIGKTFYELKFKKIAAIIILGLFILFTSAGLNISLKTPLGIDKENVQISRWINSLYANKKLNKNEHVLISYYMPDSTALLVISNRIENVHLDAHGKTCTVQFLLPFEPTCPLPKWGKDVQIVIARKLTLEEDYISYLKWKRIKEFPNWLVYKRPANSVFPKKRTVKAPGIFDRF
ncbi:MAG: hypothetical protein JXR91_10825 [Deltaproteobacteria bacterium]|nr:hypothetical protein [Deltaproteobacteria bacterium]